MIRLLRWLAVVTLVSLPVLGGASDLQPRAGWVVRLTDKPFDRLVEDVIGAIKANGLVVVTQAGPTKAAAARGIEIPGNRIIGAFNNDFAVRVIGTSVAAMIEAPIRFYVTENDDGSATLSYKTPSMIFSPYMDEGGAELDAIAAELDALFATVAQGAVDASQ
jgi:uncharacterized protein (DUF302 family)